MRNRRFPYFVAGSVVALLLLYGLFLWWCHVPVQDPATLASIESATARMLEERAAIPPDQNGFEALRSVWGLTEDPKDPAQRARVAVLPTVLASLNDYDFRVDQSRELLAREGARVGSAEEQALQEYPLLKAALEKPHFAYPSKLQIHDLTPDFVMLRQTAQMLAALGSLWAAQGHLDKALEPLLLGMGLGAKVSHNGGSLPHALGIACVRICDVPLLDILNQVRLTEPQARQLLTALEALPISPGQFLTAMDTELVLGLNALRRLAGNEPGLELHSPPIIGPIFLKREKGALVNWYLARRPEIERLELLPYPDPAQQFPWDPAVAMLAPDYLKQEAHFKYCLTRLAALQLMIALQLSRAQTGRYPDDLAQLGLKKLPVEAGKFTYEHVGADYRLGFTSPDLKLAGVSSGVVIFHPQSP